MKKSNNKRSLSPQTRATMRHLVAQSGQYDYYHGQANPPIHRHSTVFYNSAEDYLAAQVARQSVLSLQEYRAHYGIFGGMVHTELEQQLCDLDQSAVCMLTSSGLNAITYVLLAYAKPGDHLCIVDAVYGPTRVFCDQFLLSIGVNVTYYPANCGSEIRNYIRDNTTLILAESPSTATFEVQDVPAICRVAHRHGVVVALNNTWATPLYFPAMAYGVDIIIQSATKYILGHSDGFLGCISCVADCAQPVVKTLGLIGDCVSPDIAYAGLRGLRTLSVRLSHQSKSAIVVAQWLQERSEVTAVHFPVLPGDAGHHLWCRDFTGGSSLFSLELSPRYTFGQVSAFMNTLKLFRIGASYGGFESLQKPYFNINASVVSPKNKTGWLIRLYVGLEDPDDLITDLKAGFEQLKRLKNKRNL